MLNGILAIIYIYPLAALGFSPAINPPLAYRFKGASYTFLIAIRFCDHQRQTSSECASKMTDTDPGL